MCCYIYIISHSGSFISKEIFFTISEINLIFGKKFLSTANMFCDLEQVIYLARLLSTPHIIKVMMSELNKESEINYISKFWYHSFFNF